MSSLLSVVSIIAAIVFAYLAILLQRIRAGTKRELDKLFTSLSKQLNMPRPLTLDDLYEKRALLYANKRNLEAQMSKQLDTGTQKAYRAVIDQNQKNIEQLEKQLPWIPTLHKNGWHIICSRSSVP